MTDSRLPLTLVDLERQQLAETITTRLRYIEAHINSALWCDGVDDEADVRHHLRQINIELREISKAFAELDTARKKRKRIIDELAGKARDKALAEALAQDARADAILKAEGSK